MNSWGAVQQLFERALELDADERERVLAHEREHGDPNVVRRVEALLAADSAPLEGFDSNATDLLQELRAEPPAAALCGTTFGDYRVEAHVSTGGMAHVYRATRTSAGTERRVALKVLRPGLDTDAFLERFQRERETLADLEHEHIVSFLDAGALPDGRPFLAMEYVDGAPLTEWARGVPLRERVELFMRVLATVQYAHQKLVIHRDLKPSNVFVTTLGAPRLLDFGVAVVLETEGDAAGGRAPLTPVYASPEQLRGGALTTASDIYSLGVMLHELVTGKPPSIDASESDAARRPSIDARGDLGAIIDKALAPDPAQRYRSADRFAEDLRRYLALEPVSARPSSWAHRTSLFARRNRWPVTLGAAVVVALLTGWIGADVDRRSAQEEASLGWGAHSQAKYVAILLEDWMLEAIARDEALGEDATRYLEESLDRFTDRPEAETLVHLTLGQIYLERGDRARATPHIERAWELTQSTRGIGKRDRERASLLRERLAEG